jgi:hypothetical protein
MEGSALKGRSVEATFFFFGFSSMSESASCFGAGGGGTTTGAGASTDLPLSPVAAALLDRAVGLLAEGAEEEAACVFGVVERGVRVAIQYLVRREKGGNILGESSEREFLITKTKRILSVTRLESRLKV